MKTLNCRFFGFKHHWGNFSQCGQKHVKTHSLFIQSFWVIEDIKFLLIDEFGNLSVKHQSFKFWWFQIINIESIPKTCIKWKYLPQLQLNLINFHLLSHLHRLSFSLIFNLQIDHFILDFLERIIRVLNFLRLALQVSYNHV